MTTTHTTPTAPIPTAPPLDAELERLLKRMRLPYIRKAAPDVLATAKAQRWEPAEVLKALLIEEVTGRDRSSLATRRARAAFPTGKTFDAWDPQLSSIPAPTQQALRTLEWVHRRENLVGGCCGRRRLSTPIGSIPGGPVKGRAGPMWSWLGWPLGRQRCWWRRGTSVWSPVAASIDLGIGRRMRPLEGPSRSRSARRARAALRSSTDVYGWSSATTT